MDLIAIAQVKQNRTKNGLLTNIKINAQTFSVLKLMFIFLFVAGIHVNAQQVPQVTLSQKDAPLKKVFEDIEKQTGYHFIYVSEMFTNTTKVTLEIRNVALTVALDEVFRSQPLTYSVVGKNIIVKNREAVNKATAPIPQAPVQVKGTVKDENGNPLEGVSILRKGEKTGVQTDNNGNFTTYIKSAGKVDLLFSYVGYKNVLFATDGSAPLQVKMQKEAAAIDDVVVIGYQAVRRNELTGSVSSVSAKQLKDVPVNSTLEALTGRLAGVQIVTSDGAPGADAEIKVRGGASITQDNSPLYIIDGVQVEDGLNYVAPQDIESVNVLKDAATTAIYGARGANGVVIITTKGGKDARTTVNANSFLGIRKVAKLLPVMDSYNFVTYQSERVRGSYEDSLAFVNRYGEVNDLEKYRSYPNIDWQREVFGRTALMQTHNVSFSGGNRASQFNLSTTYNKEEGVLIYTGYERKLINFKFSHVANDKLSMGFTVRYNNQFRDGGGSGGTNKEGRSETSKLRSTVKYRPFFGADDPSYDDLDNYDEQYFLETGFTNPIVLSSITYRKQYTEAVNIGGNLNYNFTKYLSFKGTLGYDINLERRDAFDDPRSGNARRLTTLAEPRAVVEVSNRTLKSINQSNVFTFTNSKLAGSFNKKNRITVLLGQETYQIRSKSNNIQLRDFPLNITPEKAIGQLGLGTPMPQNPVVQESTPFIFSLFGKADYSFNQKYNVGFTLRRDASSKFPVDHQVGYFPAVSASWRLSKERFMKNVSLVRDLKLRASYGEAGNNRIPDFLYLTTMSTYISAGAVPVSYGLNGQTVPGYVASSLGNTSLVWERAVSANIGLDATLLNNKLNVSVDAYQNEGKDLLVRAPIPSTSGYSLQYQNIGSTRNRGVEVQLNSEIITKKDFTWSASFNVSFNKNTVTKLAKYQNSLQFQSGWQTTTGVLPDFWLEVGNPVGLIYGFESDGFYTLDDFNYNPANGTYTPKPGVVTSNYFGIAQPGLIKIKDLSGPNGKPDGKADADYDRKILGNTNPKFFGGLNQQFTFKGFDASIFMNFSYGNRILNASKIEFSSGNKPNGNMLRFMEDRWRRIDANGQVIQSLPNASGVITGAPPEIIAAVNANAKYWTPVRVENLSNAIVSWAVEDGSFLRVNNVTVGYTLPQKLLSKVKVKSFRAYATLNNLAILTNYTGVDPEVNTQRGSPLTPGVDFSAYPRTHSYIFGVNLSL